jgi:predicted RNase H-related nuclease YkuK (DUF458 family)
MKNFKLFGGKEIENLGEYLRNYYAKNPKVKFYVGTDSLQNGKFTKYVTTVCMLHPEHIDEKGMFHYSAGVHVVYHRENVKRIRDVFSRLWHETELTFEIAQYVHEALKDVWVGPLHNEKVPIVHLDLSDQPRYKSHQVHDVSMGYVKGQGFEVHCKPDAWCATYASDWLCH